MKTSPAEGSELIVIPSDVKEARRVRKHIEKLLQETAFDDREIFGIRLCVEEALVNAIKHGNRLDPLKTVEIQYTVEKNRFQISITDQGPGYDPNLVPDCQADENLTRPSGRGLFLMRHYMTQVVVQPPGNRLIMTKIHINGAGRDS